MGVWANLLVNGVVDTGTGAGGWTIGTNVVGTATFAADATRSKATDAANSMKVTAAAAADAVYHRFAAPKGGCTIGAWIYPTTSLAGATLTIRTDANGTVDATLDKSLSALPLNQWSFVQAYWPEGKLTPGTVYRAYLRLAGAATLWVDLWHVYEGRPGDGGGDLEEQPLLTMEVAATPGLAAAASFVVAPRLGAVYDDTWRVRSFSCRVGRSLETEQPDVGEFTVTLDNRDGAWDPSTGTRAKIGSGVRFHAYYRSSDVALFLGQVWSVTPRLVGGDQVVEVSGACLLKALGIGEWDPRLDFGVASGATSSTLTDSSRSWIGAVWAGRRVGISSGPGAGGVGTIVSNTSTTLTVDAWAGGTPAAGSSYEIVPNEETVDTRISAVLQSQGVFGSVSPSTTTVRAVETGEKVSALDHLRLCAASDGGRLYTDPGLGVVFQSRAYRRDSAGVAPTTRVGPLGIPMRDVDARLGDTLLFNDVRVTSGSSSASAQDSSSIATYGKRSLEVSTLVGPSTIAQLQDQANYVLGRWSRPVLRVPSVALLIGGTGPMEKAAVFGVVYLWSGACVIDRPVLSGGYVSGNYWVEGFSVACQSGLWDISLDVSPTDTEPWWVLGDATRGVLDSTTRLAW